LKRLHSATFKEIGTALDVAPMTAWRYARDVVPRVTDKITDVAATMNYGRAGRLNDNRRSERCRIDPDVGMRSGRAPR
jgi:hypothetical protein